MKRLLLLMIILLFLVACSSAPPGSGVKIALTYGTAQSILDTIGYDLNKEYREALHRSGAAPVSISVYDSPEEVTAKLATVRGVLIPGGMDIEPVRYGKKNHELLESTDPDLDALEFTVLTYAAKKNLPVLGICRGHQMLNVFHGGTLYQDIPAQYKADKKVAHRKQESFLFFTSSEPCFHNITLTKNSLLKKIFQKKSIKVNTYHHQGVQKLAPGLTVTARSEDGFVEAIKGTKKRFILGVQFHPEKMTKADPGFDTIFKVFVKEVKAQQNR